MKLRSKQLLIVVLPVNCNQRRSYLTLKLQRYLTPADKRFSSAVREYGALNIKLSVFVRLNSDLSKSAYSVL